jgi:predicted SprT family Zn-dependent metalloprotease
MAFTQHLRGGTSYEAGCHTCGWVSNPVNMRYAKQLAARHEDEHMLQDIVNMHVAKHELDHITVKITGQYQRTAGRAIYGERTIMIKDAILDFPDQLDDTLRHEVAHFLAYDKYGESGHGTTWKLCCAITGAKPVQFIELTAANEAALYRYRYECGSGCAIQAHKRRNALLRPGTVCTRHHLPLKEINLR